MREGSECVTDHPCDIRSLPRRRAMKKFLNTPETVLSDALRGLAAAHPELRVDLDRRIITRAELPRAGKVGLVSGGGSGHEPLHGGFVGHGMLGAAGPGGIL